MKDNRKEAFQGFWIMITFSVLLVISKFIFEDKNQGVLNYIAFPLGLGIGIGVAKQLRAMVSHFISEVTRLTKKTEDE